MAATSLEGGRNLIAGWVSTRELPLVADTYYVGMLLEYAGSVAVAADGGNTGNGTVTLATATAKAKVGAYTLECINIVENGTKAGTATADAGNTGNGTAGAVTPGTEAIEGDYIVTCTDATVSGSEVFSVIDPNGNQLEDLTVGVAYSNNHFAVTISDGATDFVAGDFWTIAITISHAGVFKLTDADGRIVNDNIELPGTASGTIAYVGDELSFTITDGSTDFAVADTFTLTVSAGSYQAYTDIQNVAAIYNGTDERVLSSSGYDNCIVAGEISKTGLVDDSGSALTLTAADVESLRRAGFLIKEE